MTLERAQLGRLAAFARTSDLLSGVMDAFSAADWTGFSGSGTCTPSVSADATPGELIAAVNSGGGARGARLTTVVEEDQFIIAVCTSQTTGGTSGAIGRIKPASPTTDYVAATTPKGFSGSYGLSEVLSGASQQQKLTAANRSASLESRHALSLDGTAGDSYQEAGGSVGPATITQAFDNPMNASTNGTQGGVVASSSSANTFRYRQYAAMRSKKLVVNGPATGTWYVRLRDATGALLYTSDAAVAGVVEIDCMALLTTLFSRATPLMAQIEIYDGVTVVEAPVVPSARLWGGDVWTYVPVPTTPTDLTVDNPTAFTLDISWTQISTPVADGFKLQRSLNGVTGWSEVYDGVAADHIDEDLNPDTTYYYRVAAYNAGGQSEWSDVVSGTTTSADIPGVPRILRVAEVTEESITLRWSPP